MRCAGSRLATACCPADGRGGSLWHAPRRAGGCRPGRRIRCARSPRKEPLDARGVCARRSSSLRDEYVAGAHFSILDLSRAHCLFPDVHFLKLNSDRLLVNQGVYVCEA